VSGGSLSVPPIDADYLRDVLIEMLRTPSPSGRTDHIVQLVGDHLTDMGFEPEVTRRGALLLDWEVPESPARRALIAHVDTLGCMVRGLKDNGRLQIIPLGTHSPRFCEGVRVTIYTDDHERDPYTGTILPLKASGHRYGDEVDTQPVDWTNLEVRIDEHVHDRAGLVDLGIQVGDFIAIDANPVISPSGFLNARHLDDKAGVAAVLATLKAMADHDAPPLVSTQVLITISEEVGHGASTGLDDDVAELVAVDNAVVAPGQQCREDEVTVVMHDLHGPFDYHLSRHLTALAAEHGIPHQRDIFDFYRSDAAAALEAGMATRAALVGFGVDASHGYERTHLDGLSHLARLLVVFLRSELTFTRWDLEAVGPLEEFPSIAVQPSPLQEPR
jgi:peptidase M42 family hydrolase